VGHAATGTVRAAEPCEAISSLYVYVFSGTALSPLVIHCDRARIAVSQIDIHAEEELVEGDVWIFGLVRALPRYEVKHWLGILWVAEARAAVSQHNAGSTLVGAAPNDAGEIAAGVEQAVVDLLVPLAGDQGAGHTVRPRRQVHDETMISSVIDGLLECWGRVFRTTRVG